MLFRSAQLSRSNEQRTGDKKPLLSDLRESGSIEQDADVVIMLYRGDYYEPGKDTQTEAMVMKNRNGPVGNVKLAFRKDILRFDSYIPESNAVGE